MTFPNSVSYGATLQMYALYRAVEKLGAEPEIINYQNSYMRTECHTGATTGTLLLKKKIRLALRHIVHCRQYRRFHAFEKRMAVYPHEIVGNHETLCGLGKRYDAVICGSDQVWNPQITGEDCSYFLDFCKKETKRISYAPSFGVVQLENSFRDKIRKELEQFSAVSVREEEGRQLVIDMLGKDVPVVLDPTFLLTKEDWELLEQYHPYSEEEYILYYTVSSSRSLMRMCMEFAEKTNKKVIVVGGNEWKKLRNKDERLKYACDLSPGQWLNLLHHADYVVTNSFHGTAFSIHYQKDFFLEFSSNTNSRLEQIVRISGLEDRVVTSGIPEKSQRIDYASVVRLLGPYRETSVDYLRDSIC